MQGDHEPRITHVRNRIQNQHDRHVQQQQTQGSAGGVRPPEGYQLHCKKKQLINRQGIQKDNEIFLRQHRWIECGM